MTGERTMEGQPLAGQPRKGRPGGPTRRGRKVAADEEGNLALVAAMYERVLQPLDSSRVDAFFAPDYIQHSPLAATGARGLKEFLDWARSRSPNAEHRVKRLFVDGDYVIAHVHVIINPGDRGNAVVDIFRIADGRIAEHWDVAQEVPASSANENGVF